MKPKTRQSGFTLIELLVAVLIITILGVIAVSQYQRAVDKAKFAQYKAIAHTLYTAEREYYLTHGEHSHNLKDLMFQVPPPSNKECTYVSKPANKADGDYYDCKRKGDSTPYLRYGIFDYGHNIQVGDYNIRYVQFIQGGPVDRDGLRNYDAKEGEIACFARTDRHRRVCASLGPFKRTAKAPSNGDWNKYFF